MVKGDNMVQWGNMVKGDNMVQWGNMVQPVIWSIGVIWSSGMVAIARYWVYNLIITVSWCVCVCACVRACVRACACVCTFTSCSTHGLLFSMIAHQQSSC